MELTKIKYDDLNAKQREIYNFQKLAAVLADYGFNCIKLLGSLRISHLFSVCSFQICGEKASSKASL